jgi:HSP20 family molecular chaperone IbpA
MDNLFNRFFDADFPLPQEFFKEGQWAPRVDISEGEKDITIQAEIPGCDAKDIAILCHLWHIERTTINRNRPVKQWKHASALNNLGCNRVQSTRFENNQ